METKIRIEKLKVAFGKNEILKGISADVFKNQITGFMGPAASGKSTLISIINRMIDFEDDVRIEGSVFIDDEDILGDEIDDVQLEEKGGHRFCRAHTACPARFSKTWPTVLGFRE